ncbi:MAG: methionyl-tRNA formyltransferase [Candidatus Hodarchaeota archaeon]
MSSDLKIIFFGNNRVALEVLKYLKQEKENIVGLVVHPDSRAKYKSEILEVFPKKVVFEGDKLKESAVINQLKELNPDIFLSIYFGYILSPEVLKIPSRGAFNLHPAYLPYNKGVHPNVWSIVDGTPAGATIHYMDEGVDTGAIIGRKKVESDYSDTGKTLYEKLEISAIELFKEIWPSIKKDEISTIKPEEEGTMHYLKDFVSLDEIDPNKEYKALDLINILRARTFPPYKSAFVRIGGKKYYIEITLKEDDE